MHICNASVFFGKEEVVKYLSICIFFRKGTVLEINFFEPKESRKRKILSVRRRKIQDYYGSTN